MMPGLVWSGAGKVTLKSHYFGNSDGWTGMEMANPIGNPIGVADSPVRWILRAQDNFGKVHDVFVGEQHWHQHHVGDVITADDPLLDVRT